MRDIDKDLWTNANNYQSDNLFSLRGWISDIKDKTAGDPTSYGWMDGWMDRPLSLGVILCLGVCHY